MIPSEEFRASLRALDDDERAHLHDILAKACQRCGLMMFSEAFARSARVLRARDAARTMIQATVRGAADLIDVSECIYGWDSSREELQEVTAIMSADGRPGVRHLGRLWKHRLCL